MTGFLQHGQEFMQALPWKWNIVFQLFFCLVIFRLTKAIRKRLMKDFLQHWQEFIARAAVKMKYCRSALFLSLFFFWLSKKSHAHLLILLTFGFVLHGQEFIARATVKMKYCLSALFLSRYISAHKSYHKMFDEGFYSALAGIYSKSNRENEILPLSSFSVSFCFGCQGNPTPACESCWLLFGERKEVRRRREWKRKR